MLLSQLLALLIVLNTAVVLGIWLTGPLKLDAGSLPFRVPLVNPLYVLPALVVAWCALRWRRWRGWIGLAAGRRLRLGGVSPVAWVVIPLSLALLWAQVLSVTWQVLPIPRKVRKSARVGPAGMSVNAANRHAGPLVRTLVQRPSAEPPVIWIDDLDARGHTASFYLYPRLMLMEPKQRRWTLEQRMTVLGGPNPLFQIGRRPAKALSEAFAQERGTQLLFARKPGSGPKAAVE